MKSLGRNDGGDVRLQHWVMTSKMGAESQGEQAPGLSGVDVTKVHNPDHTTSVTVTTGSRGSSIMDTTSECPVTGACCDFSELGDRNRAISRMCSEKPNVLITSPLCTALSKLTSLNVRHTSPSERKQIANKAQRHLQFICKLIMIQHRDGRHFIHEPPGGTSSWQDQCVQEVLTVTQATITEFDQCLFWLMATDRNGSLKHCRRRSKLVSTMPAIDSTFSGKLCPERHKHAHLAEEETHDALHHSCPKPSRQRSNCRRNATQAVSNCWQPLKQRESHKKDT